MRVMSLRGYLNATSAVLAVAVAMGLGSPSVAQTQVTNQSTTSLHESSSGNQSGGGPLVQQNINVAGQEADVTGCAQVIDQVIFQSSLNFNLVLQGFPQTSVDPSQILNGLDFSKIVPLDKVPFTFPVPSDPNAKVTNQTIVENSININAPGATPSKSSSGGTSVTVTDTEENVSEVDQSNLNVAAQVVNILPTFGSIDQAILQSTVDFNRTLVYAGQPLDLASLLNGLDFVTPLTITTHHTDGPGCPQGPGAPPMDFIEQTIIQTALNFNILQIENSSELPAVNQATDDTGIQVVNIVPEPSSLVTCVVGLPGLLMLRRRAKRARASSNG
jgi:hypothetical protein